MNRTFFKLKITVKTGFILVSRRLNGPRYFISLDTGDAPIRVWNCSKLVNNFSGEELPTVITIRAFQPYLICRLNLI